MFRIGSPSRLLPAVLARSAMLAALVLAPLSEGVTLAAETGSGKAAPGSIDSLFLLFKKNPGLSADFHEEKSIVFLKSPLLSEGTMHFSAPSSLVRRTASPEKSVLLLEGTKLQVSDKRGRRTIELKDHISLLAMVSSFSHFMSGDRPALEKNFVLEFQGGASWSLALVPRSDELKKLVKRITLTGADETLQGYTVEEASGDRTVTTLRNVVLNKKFSDDEKKRLFSLD